MIPFGTIARGPTINLAVNTIYIFDGYNGASVGFQHMRIKKVGRKTQHNVKAEFCRAGMQRGVQIVFEGVKGNQAIYCRRPTGMDVLMARKRALREEQPS